ncbi:hypothetical protein AB0O47_39675 [Streptomyces noursei]|uniref:hypothetical protein n=1 Tax=Streptomyces noursei TaxID=1971 RepID=UPI00344FFE7F
MADVSVFTTEQLQQALSALGLTRAPNTAPPESTAKILGELLATVECAARVNNHAEAAGERDLLHGYYSAVAVLAHAVDTPTANLREALTYDRLRRLEAEAHLINDEDAEPLHLALNAAVTAVADLGKNGKF